MARTFTLKGKTYHCAGRVSELRKDEHIERLEALRCSPMTLLKADVVIAGTGGKKKIDQARERGIPVISQEEALIALGDKKGVVALASSDITQIIGELRSLFARKNISGSDLWLLCAGILGRCDVEQFAPVLEYARTAFVRAVNTKQTWRPRNTKHRLMNEVNSKWVQGNPGNELFVAPPGWLLEMAAGDYHPKHSLVRAINLDHHRFTTRKLKALLSNPYLKGIHFLNFGRRARDPGEILGELDTFEGLDLREIWLYEFNDKLSGRLAMNETALRKVHTLVFHGCKMHYMDEDHYGSLSEALGLEVVADIKELKAFDEQPQVLFRRIGNR